MDIKVGQTVTVNDEMYGKSESLQSGEVITFQNGIVGIRIESGEVIYRYEKQVVSIKN